MSERKHNVEFLPEPPTYSSVRVYDGAGVLQRIIPVDELRAHRAKHEVVPAQHAPIVGDEPVVMMPLVKPVTKKKAALTHGERVEAARRRTRGAKPDWWRTDSAMGPKAAQA